MNTLTLNMKLRNIDPPIWRRIRVSSKVSLLELHHVIQLAFGWSNSHLFIINIGGMQFVDYHRWEQEAYNYQSAALAKLGDFVPKLIPIGGEFSYVYDMGDYWEHEILIENSQASSRPVSVPVCLDGAGACPPEDVGGPPGYFDIIEAFQNPTSQQYHQYFQWLNYVYDPKAFDLDQTNQFIQDHYYAAQLRQDTYWARNLPLYHPHVDFVSGWINQLTPENRQYAKELAFRRDVKTMLTYLRDHKVLGTKASGNFPCKDIRAMTADFVDPPVLDQVIGDRVYKLRTENEVPDLLFMHNFINIAGLIVGGENLVWRLTQLGELYLERSPEEQAWFLTKVWFYQFNWEVCYPFEDAWLNQNLLSFQLQILNLLLDYPIGDSLDIDKIIHDIDQSIPDWVVMHSRPTHNDFHKKHYFLSIIVEPFEKMGLFEVIKDRNELVQGISDYTHIVITDYGKSLMRYFI